MQIKNISDRNGRALEYKIVDFLRSNKSKFNATLTPQAMSDLKRDFQKYKKLPPNLKTSYELCSTAIHNWLLTILPDKNIIIHKHTDQEAKLGEIADISITSAKKTINLSIKHNHTAIKHQRPSTTAMQCGYKKDSAEDLKFRINLKAIIDKFLKDAEKAIQDAVNFRDLTRVDSDYINNKLYIPVCSLVKKTINKLCKNKENVQALFNFLVGSTSFYKVIDYKNIVKILDFTSIKPSKTVKAQIKCKSYVKLTFSNGWKISMRIHTAASKLSNSLKFDTQPSELPNIKEIYLSK